MRRIFLVCDTQEKHSHSSALNSIKTFNIYPFGAEEDDLPLVSPLIRTKSVFLRGRDRG
jgi:hypothetical protein